MGDMIRQRIRIFVFSIKKNVVENNNETLIRMYNVRFMYAETDVLDFTILSSCTTDDKRTRKK